MRLPSPECPAGFLVGIDVKDDPGDYAPVRIFCRGV